MLAAYLPLAVWTLAILGLPPLGAWLAGEPLDQYLQFPLTGRAADPLPYSPAVLWVTLVSVSGLLLVLLWLAWPQRPTRPPTQAEVKPASSADFPPWGWAGIAAIGGAGLLPGLGLPALLAGVMLLANADSERRTGGCVLTRRPAYLAAMLPAGALLGWLYHWLNLFLQLWHYPGGGDGVTFALARTLDYALLLPACLSLRQWLGSFEPVLRATKRGRAVVPPAGESLLGGALLATGGIGLAGAAVWPDWLFPLTWTAPLLIAIGLALIAGRPTAFTGVTDGDWSRVVLPASAALLLGLLVQLWGALSGREWVLALPLVDTAPLLGLPALAYLGFIPLGLVAIWLSDQLARPWRRRPLKRFPKFPIKVVIKP